MPNYAQFLDQTPLTSAPLIYINGLPSVGKTTVARELIRLLGADNAVLPESHAPIHPVAAKYACSDSEYQEEGKAERARCFDTYVKNEEMRDSVAVFTECRSNVGLDAEVAREFQDIAVEARRPFIPILLVCDIEEHLRRVGTRGQKESSTTEPTSQDMVRHKRETEELYEFDIDNELILDITHVRPGTAAKVIVQWVANREWRRRHRDMSRRC
ncbi:hypothetical protein M3J09_000849 [Ascochyta lentis]